MLVRIIHTSQRLAALNDYHRNEDKLIREVKQLLFQQNMYNSKLDSSYDLELREAIMQFQDHNKLPATGIIDPTTYCRLQKSQVFEIPLVNKTRSNTNTLTKANLLISKSSRQLTLFDSNTPVRNYPVAIGKPSTPTPVGNFAIAYKIMNPGGILGSRWLGLNFDSYGIHGTRTTWIKMHDKSYVLASQIRCFVHAHQYNFKPFHIMHSPAMLSIVH